VPRTGEGSHTNVYSSSLIALRPRANGLRARERPGWSRRTAAQDFLNVGPDGPHSPGFHQETSLFLIQERDILGVGVETVGTDAGQAGRFDPPFPNHTLMHGAGKFGLASLRNLDQLPPTGAVVIAAPLKIVDGSGSPLRVLALVE
jgi:kynurenine formamidase